jgi:hypothetical protein
VLVKRTSARLQRSQTKHPYYVDVAVKLNILVCTLQQELRTPATSTARVLSLTAECDMTRIVSSTALRAPE